MAEFDESKVINVLHTDKAVIGKKYWFADHILSLKTVVEESIKDNNLYKLTGIDEISHYCFESDNESEWEFIYPYEEPPKSSRPYENTEELVNDFCERFHYTYQKSDSLPLIWFEWREAKWLIGGIAETIVFSDGNKFTMQYLFDNCNYLDGSPMGKLEK